MFFGGPEEMQALPAVLVDPNAHAFLSPTSHQKPTKRSAGAFCLTVFAPSEFESLFISNKKT